MRLIGAIEFIQQSRGILANLPTLVNTLAAHAPGVVKIRPVDIGSHIAYLIYYMLDFVDHHILNWIASPRTFPSKPSGLNR